ncbi:hypothetical protein [Gracilibacillus saliphilus]|uniref:hypothetical protein n=1 Tax=Gracilibacillus saliphilus TaxID=543890 RepID=UPI0013D28709|nr:hypothetical protein [Gracilibacillus saliphilus]
MANKYIYEGVKLQELKKKQETSRQEENKTNINLSENRKMTSEEKDQHILNLTDAVNQLTERLNQLEGNDNNE